MAFSGTGNYKVPHRRIAKLDKLGNDAPGSVPFPKTMRPPWMGNASQDQKTKYSPRRNATDPSTSKKSASNFAGKSATAVDLDKARGAISRRLGVSGSGAASHPGMAGRKKANQAARATAIAQAAKDVKSSNYAKRGAH